MKNKKLFIVQFYVRYFAFQVTHRNVHMSSKTQTCWFHYMSTSHRHNGIYCTEVLSTNPHKPVDIRRFNAKHDLANLGTSHIVRNTSNALTTTCFIVFMKTFSKIWNSQKHPMGVSQCPFFSSIQCPKFERFWAKNQLFANCN